MGEKRDHAVDVVAGAVRAVEQTALAEQPTERAPVEPVRPPVDLRARAAPGDARVILWPFEGKTGPMGKAPLMRAERKGALVTRLAFRPSDEVLAVGFSDGAVVLARLADEGVIDLDEPGGAITALTWNDAGTRLAWGDENGRVGLIDMATRA